MVSMFEVAEDDSHAPQSEACATGPRNGYALYEVDQKDWTLPNSYSHVFRVLPPILEILSASFPVN